MRDQLVWVCPACARTVRVPRTVERISCSCGHEQLNGPTPGLGDDLAAALARAGLTKALYIRLRRKIGLRKPCGCRKRQKKLNEIGNTFGIG